jgi:hypothetical protein
MSVTGFSMVSPDPAGSDRPDQGTPVWSCLVRAESDQFLFNLQFLPLEIMQSDLIGSRTLLFFFNGLIKLAMARVKFFDTTLD